MQSSQKRKARPEAGLFGGSGDASAQYFGDGYTLALDLVDLLAAI